MFADCAMNLFPFLFINHKIGSNFDLFIHDYSISWCGYVADIC